MTVAPDSSNKTAYNNPRGIPRVKLWIFFFLFLTVGLSMYAGTMYRIRHYGYTGLGQDRLAHPEETQPAQASPAAPATPPQN